MAICKRCYGIQSKSDDFFSCICPLPEYEQSIQLCRSEITEGDYDYIIKEGIKDIVGEIMEACGGKSNPKQILERIAKLTEEIKVEKG